MSSFRKLNETYVKNLKDSNIHLGKILEKFSVINYSPSSHGLCIGSLVHFSSTWRNELQYFMNITKVIALEREKPHSVSGIEINYSQFCARFRHCDRPAKV